MISILRTGPFSGNVCDGIRRLSAYYWIEEVGARRDCSKGGSSDLKAERPRRGFCAWFKTGPGTVAGFFHMDIHDRRAGGVGASGTPAGTMPGYHRRQPRPLAGCFCAFPWRLRAGVSGVENASGEEADFFKKSNTG
jgi:hypothetical protein